MTQLTRRAAFGVLLTAASMVAAAPVLAQSRTGGSPNSMFAGIGMKGYDPVAYFEDGKATQGNPDITASDGALTWHFSSEAHKAAFEANPNRYQPQYGGFCSWGVANGKLFEVDPENGWVIINDKLYVTFNADIKAVFVADASGLITKADANWPTLNQ